ncbi:Galactoside 2-alpha-L-fucosyltransferase [Citrus sinensis]|uniref:Galactoside 2-alpha-L-fucosyltransferase n=1 Tax=Citrus sinensis TaxID=2711 RepID=A0ACB8LL64_CITSI|nr:Galactoside 2-alpha-L-fucosyltransferase [Citrus sinensis]
MDPHSHRRRHHRSDFRFNINTTRLAKILATGLIILPILVILSLITRQHPSDHTVGLADARIVEAKSFLYLIYKLINYEALHKYCGPKTQSYNKTLKKVKSSHSSSGSAGTDCKYVVWVAFSGLGNKVLSVTAVLLYALLTNRVMLIDRGEDTVDLFYEPFPKTSWIPPLDFLITQKFNGFNMKSPELFDTRPGPFKYVIDKILDCTLKQKLLPEVDNDESAIKSSAKPKLKAVLVTSLNSRYYGILRNMYWEYSTVTGDMVTVYQPSHEEYQQTEKSSHNGKALAEMYLLGITDVLITSSWFETMLFKAENDTTPNPACQKDESMEPCFHTPPFYDCRGKSGIDTGSMVPYVTHCRI